MSSSVTKNPKPTTAETYAQNSSPTRDDRKTNFFHATASRSADSARLSRDEQCAAASWNQRVRPSASSAAGGGGGGGAPPPRPGGGREGGEGGGAGGEEGGG